MNRRFVALLGPALLLGLLGLSGSAQATERTWHFDQARIPGAHAMGYYGRGVTVAVIDTWVDRGHGSLKGHVLPGADCSGSPCRSVAAPADQCKHGTHVAGTVVSQHYGVAPQATVLPIRVLKWNASAGTCTGNSTDAAAAIRYAINHGARVINLSLGGESALITQAPDMTNAIREASNAGIVVVIAAGNSDKPLNAQYGDTALVVAATNNRAQLTSYTERGSGIDVAAPGGDAAGGGDDCSQATCVASTWPRDKDGDAYAAMAGTSMAAPHVSGLAALLIAQSPSRGRADVLSTIKGTARALAEAGAGLIDATAALKKRHVAPKPTPKPTLTTTSPRPQPTRTTAAPTPSRSATPSPTATASPSATPTVTASPSESPSAEPTVAVADPGPAGENRTVPVGVAAGLVAVLTAALLLTRQRAS